MQRTLHDHSTFMSTRGRHVGTLRFAGDIDLKAGRNSELRDLTNKLVEKTTAYGIELNTEKFKLMVNSTNNTSVNVTMDGDHCKKCPAFIILGSNPVNDTCNA